MKSIHSFMKRSAALLLAMVLFTGQALAAYSTLEYGSRGSDVLKLQKALLELGFDPNGTDGKFGSGTKKAVIAYQKSRGLTADGKAGNKTLTKLYSETDGNTSSSGSSSSDYTSGTSSNPNTLEYGDSGTRVSEMQGWLKTLGYYTGSVDGKFGAGTKRAVVAFQKAAGLTADGLAGTKTLSKLQSMAEGSSGSSSGSSSSTGSSSSSSSSSSSATPSRTLRKGYTGEDVKTVQTRLKELKYYSGSIDGVYGSGSIAAVKAFQKANGLTADGLAGTKTFKILFSSSAIASGSSSSSSSGVQNISKLQSGDKGDAVKTLQKALAKLNYSVSADGVYGPQTMRAVKAFQEINGLTVDGIAGKATQELLYSGNAKKYDSSSISSSGNYGSIEGPNKSQVQLLHWIDEVKPSLKTGQNIEAYDPETGISWTLYVMSRGRHADVEPLTADDTAAMMAAFGGVETWTPKPVYIKLPDGRWSLATTHNVAHGSQVIGGNNFDGQNCVHFLRDMDECILNDPDYGVSNQNALRKAWKALTGITVP